MVKKGYRNVTMKEAVIIKVEQRIDRLNRRKTSYPVSVPRYITEAVEEKLNRGS